MTISISKCIYILRTKRTEHTSDLLFKRDITVFYKIQVTENSQSW